MSLLPKQLLDSSRGRIVTLLRGGGQTADDLASELGLTRSAVRAQLTAMERDGLVRRAGHRPGTTRPSLVFMLTADVEQLLSGAYIPLLVQLVDVCVEGMPADRLEALLRTTGRRLAEELTEGTRPSGELSARVAAASQMLNERLGATTRVEENGKYVIQGLGCPLAALTRKHPGVCLALESLLAEVVDAPVRECCERGDRPRCRFEIRRRGHSSKPSKNAAR